MCPTHVYNYVTIAKIPNQSECAPKDFVTAAVRVSWLCHGICEPDSRWLTKHVRTWLPHAATIRTARWLVDGSPNGIYLPCAGRGGENPSCDSKSTSLKTPGRKKRHFGWKECLPVVVLQTLLRWSDTDKNFLNLSLVTWFRGFLSTLYTAWPAWMPYGCKGSDVCCIYQRSPLVQHSNLTLRRIHGTNNFEKLPWPCILNANEHTYSWHVGYETLKWRQNLDSVDNYIACHFPFVPSHPDGGVLAPAPSLSNLLTPSLPLPPSLPNPPTGTCI